ncbi:DMT family transporter [Campylobacter corcagiensis]|uniref:QacE family quaternary ammonium compound efflux SMR transporter n=1 Tax=Campylobacter corcagiensis TaxID=1448857 RepID=A0A7M1LJU7_9BACT|nr:SMR family transporter [Campylobacter corcagiensis]QKF63992.1 multidrug efflux system protein, EmrE family [Campylobacter corcagiensis]QOQ87805.1 QacE family quaternary ammonium compound efflux SMR transporter [Campylobacter corcagiensis]
MVWFYIFLAVFGELIWVTALKHASDMSGYLVFLIGVSISFPSLLKASELGEVSTVYTVFVGVGAAGVVLIEMLFYGEPFDWLKIFLITTLFSGVIGMVYATQKESKK